MNNLSAVVVGSRKCIYICIYIYKYFIFIYIYIQYIYILGFVCISICNYVDMRFSRLGVTGDW